MNTALSTRTILIGLFCSLLAGCLNVPPYVSPNGSPDGTPVPTSPTGTDGGSPTPGSDSDSGVPAHSSTHSGNFPAEPTPSTPAPDVTLALLADSDREADRGNFAAATAYVERAIRLEPRRGDLWNRLAKLKVDAREPDAAINFAQKALSLSGNRLDWQRDAWLVIARAKELQGLDAEALRIRERWQTLRG